jgi:hypothetical protein
MSSFGQLRFALTAVALLGTLALAAPAHADALSEVRGRAAQVTRLENQRAQLDGQRTVLERESQALSSEIDRQKAEPAGLRRDARLQELLAAQKTKADALQKEAGALRAGVSQLTSARRALVAACDRALGASLPEAQRLELSRLRTAQVTLLAMPSSPGSSAPAVNPTVSIDPLDGPRELTEKADLLRDSEDKLRREVERISARIDDVERRRHLRERAGAVDEDWFGESTSDRKVARASTSHTSTTSDGQSAANTPSAASGGAPPPGGGTPTVGGSLGSPSGGGSGATPTGSFGGDMRTDTTVLRNLVDPATLDELRRSGDSDDLDRQVRALKRAQGELKGLAGDLEKRARTLSTRADQLKNRK